MVNAVNLVFGKGAVQGGIQRERRFGIVTEGFFDDQPFPALAFIVHADLVEPLCNGGIQTGRRGQVIKNIAAGLMLFRQQSEARLERVKIGLFRRIDLLVINMVTKTIRGGFRRVKTGRLFRQIFTQMLGKTLIIVGGATDTDNGKILGQQAAHKQPIEGGNEFPVGQIARCAKNNQKGVGIHQNKISDQRVAVTGRVSIKAENPTQLDAVSTILTERQLGGIFRLSRRR